MDLTNPSPLVENIAKVAQAIGVLIAAISLLYTAEVRRRDLKWRKALECQRMLDQIHSHELAREAINFMDRDMGGFKYLFIDSSGKASQLGLIEVLEQFGKGFVASEEAKHLYTCFDWFFYYTDRIAYMVMEAKLLSMDDVASTYSPYAETLLKEDRWDLIKGTIEKHNYMNVQPFLKKVRLICPVQSGVPIDKPPKQNVDLNKE
jgi:hypothetical protein